MRCHIGVRDIVADITGTGSRGYIVMVGAHSSASARTKHVQRPEYATFPRQLLTSAYEDGLAAVLFAGDRMQIGATLLHALAKRDTRLHLFPVHVIGQVDGAQPILVSFLMSR